jgi:hypothetical protein
MHESTTPYCEVCLMPMVPHRTYHGCHGETYEQYSCPYCRKAVLMRKYSNAATTRCMELIPYERT